MNEGYIVGCSIGMRRVRSAFIAIGMTAGVVKAVRIVSHHRLQRTFNGPQPKIMPLNMSEFISEDAMRDSLRSRVDFNMMMQGSFEEVNLCCDCSGVGFYESQSVRFNCSSLSTVHLRLRGTQVQ